MHSGTKYSIPGLALIFLFFTCLFPFMPGHPYDNHCWQAWAQHIYRDGLSHAYTSDTNYLPCYQYVLWLFGKLAGSEAAIKKYYYLLRCFTLLFEIWGLWLVWKWANLKMDFLTLAALCLFNIGYSYNTLVWGQVDAIGATLIFSALYAAWRRKLLLSGALLVLAVNMKLQMIIFLPVWGLLMLYSIPRERRVKEILPVSGIMLLAQLLLLAPFATAGVAGIKPIWNVLRNSAGYFPQLSMNAYNLWYWVARNPIDVKDSIVLLAGISAKNWGLLLFLLTSLAALLPLLRAVFFKAGSNGPLNPETVWLTSALVALLFFFCNTEMHERYPHPALIFIAAYACRTRRLAPFLLCSVAYFLNMEGVLRWLTPAGSKIILLNGAFVAVLYAVLILYLFVLLYRERRAARLSIPSGRVLAAA